MTGILSWLLDASVIVFAVTSMLSVGFGHTFAQVLGPLRNLRGVIRALLANFVLVPALAFLVLQLLPLPATIVYMPLVVPLALPEAEVSTLAIAVPLVLTMLLPLAVGLLVRARSECWAKRLQPGVGTISTVSLVVLILAIVLANPSGILDVLFTTAIVAALLVIGGAFLIGYLLGMDRGSREVLGLGTSQRNIAAATVVATQAVGDPDTVVMVTVASLAGFAILFPVTAWLRKRSSDEG